MIKNSTDRILSSLQRLYKSIWLFPALGMIILVILTSLRISGSSVGFYYKDMYGPSAKDPNLIVGRPRSIRSDEWEWQSQMIIAQKKIDYQRINQNIGNGQNMEVIVDVPYKNWSVIFKPQNLGFFVLPFEYAFALKWWLLSYLLVIGAYFFILMLLPKERLIASILSVCLLLSPFVQWWYQTITVAPIAYSLLIAVTAVNLWQTRGRKQIWWSLLVAYLLACFAIVLYPPFQIPCMLVVAALLIGYFGEKGFFKDKQMVRRGLKYCSVSIVLFAIIVSGFLLTNKEAIQATQNSVYPGKRVAVSGHFDAQVFFANFLDSQLQRTSQAKKYVANQSEASNFLLLSPFLTLPIIFLLIRAKKMGKKTDWPLLLVTILLLLFMVRIFVPGTNALFNLLLLGSVPHARLLIGIGLASFIQLILLLRHLRNNKISNRLLATLTACTALVFNLVIGLLTRQDHPGYIDKLFILIPLALIPAVIVYLVLSRKTIYAACLLFIFSLGSVGIIHPLYRGLGPLYESKIVHSIQKISDQTPEARWAVVGNLVYENLPAISNADSLTATYAYPQKSFWASAREISDQEDIYNRYAHTLVRFAEEPARLNLHQADFFQISGSPCSSFFNSIKVKFFVSEKDYSNKYPCLVLNQSVQYPNKTFYILELR